MFNNEVLQHMNVTPILCWM